MTVLDNPQCLPICLNLVFVVGGERAASVCPDGTAMGCVQRYCCYYQQVRVFNTDRTLCSNTQGRVILKITMYVCFPRYWYMGPLKTKAAHWLSTLRVSPTVVIHFQDGGQCTSRSIRIRKERETHCKWCSIIESNVDLSQCLSGVAPGTWGLAVLPGAHPSARWPAHSKAPEGQPAVPHHAQTKELLVPTGGR